MCQMPAFSIGLLGLNGRCDGAAHTAVGQQT